MIQSLNNNVQKIILQTPKQNKQKSEKEAELSHMSLFLSY